jgi:hypothetical protein
LPFPGRFYALSIHFVGDLYGFLNVCGFWTGCPLPSHFLFWQAGKVSHVIGQILHPNLEAGHFLLVCKDLCQQQDMQAES